MNELVRFERSFIAGVDVGQVNDWTAISIVEKVEPIPAVAPGRAHHRESVNAAAKIETRLDLRHLERIPLGTRYPDQVTHVRELLRRPQLEDVRTFLDMTGCGRPVFDMFKLAGLRDLSGVMITGATSEPRRMPYGWNVGKAELVNRVQVEMQTGRLRIGRAVEHVDKLVRELREFRVKTSASGHMTFNAREGQNDDLVLSLALAVFGALRPRPVYHLDMRIAS